MQVDIQFLGWKNSDCQGMPEEIVHTYLFIYGHALFTTVSTAHRKINK